MLDHRGGEKKGQAANAKASSSKGPRASMAGSWAPTKGKSGVKKEEIDVEVFEELFDDGNVTKGIFLLLADLLSVDRILIDNVEQMRWPTLRKLWTIAAWLLWLAPLLR